MNINVGSRWRASDFSEFVVEAVKVLGGDCWVHYAKTNQYGSATEQKFSCLAEAFKIRFHPTVE